MSELGALDRYLLQACSPCVDDAARIPIAAWPGILERAGPHKLTNLVLDRWAGTALGLPESAKATRRRAAALNLAFAARLLELLEVLDAHGIYALSFKGPLLAETVFGGIVNRNFWDLDILVPREDLLYTCRLLVDFGYCPLGGASLEASVRVTLRGGHHVVLQHRQHGTCVEIHWELSGRYLPVALEFATVKPYLTRATFCERPVWNLSPEMALLYLCIHGAREYWRILDHVVCVAWQWDRAPPDWEAFLELAKRWGAHRIAITGIGLAATLFELELTPGIAGPLARSPAVRRLIARQTERIFHEDRLTVLRLGYLPEFMRMHWTHLGDPIHFSRWVALRLTTPRAEDLAPEGAGGRSEAEVGPSTKRGGLRSGIRALRRFF